MVVKKLKELYPVDTISQDKGWKKVNEALVEGEEILIDFSGTNVVDPWEYAEFKKLIKNPLVHMKFVNCDEMVKRIKIMCVVEGLDESRIINEVVEIPKEKTAEEKKIERIGTELIDLFIIEGSKARFDVAGKYSQMHSTNTLNYIKYAIDKLVEEKGIKTVVINLVGVSVLRNVIELIADMIVHYKKIDVDLLVDINDEESINNLRLFIHQATNKAYDAKEKALAIKSHVRLNTAGMLIKYKKSKAVDEFGRHGNGEVVSSRIARFLGIVEDDAGRTLAKIESYNTNNFYTKQHWMVEHDNEIPRSLNSEVLEIPMDEIGYGDLFLGSQYHFMAPVQQNANESRVVITDVDENDRNIKQMCTIPERIKIVFDDWGVEYDKEALEEAIIATKELLNKQ